MEKNSNILLVENDFYSQKVIELFLRKDYSIDYAEDGLTAVEKVKQKKYAAVLLDIELGHGINGIDVIKRIRRIPEYKDVPIIAVTANALIGDREKYLSQGFTHYIAKPFSRDELLSLLKNII